MSEGTPKRGPGRPRKHKEEAKRAFFQTRIRETLKQRLEEAAKREGRSLSEEIELRLEDSFGRVDSAFGGPLGLHTAIMLYANYRYAGDVEARRLGHPNWTIAEWILNQDCCE